MRQMQAREENMQNARNRLGVKSVQWKIETRGLEKIGHVTHVGNDRLTNKANVELVRKIGSD